mmetsp:Transcript_9882/g.17310  ORF Transcript_9882/g.17310 Transcript_9882/m.17310 type:complete len:130 (-) Transcript_9882:813-1202(-)
MWQEIQARSGLPFPQYITSPTGVDDVEIDAGNSRSVTSLLSDFHFADQRQGTYEVETAQLQQELVQATNHAVAVEIEVLAVISSCMFMVYLSNPNEYIIVSHIEDVPTQKFRLVEKENGIEPLKKRMLY